MFYKNQNHFYISQKKILQRILFLPVFIFLCLALKGSFSSAPKQEYEILVLWKDSVTAKEAAHTLCSLLPDCSLTDHAGDFSVCSVRTSSPAALLSALNSTEMVRIAELNSHTTLSSLTDAEFYPTQWALHNPGEYPYYINNLAVERPSVSDVDLNLPEAYTLLEKLPATRTVTVAIIDTGVDISHPALSEHLWINEKEIPDNDIDDDGNGYIDDVYGWDFYHNDNTVCHYLANEDGSLTALSEDDDTHGTHCAGIIAASGAVAGVASGIDVRILPLKIHGGTHASGSVANAVKAIKYAQFMGADICNLSWGTTVYSELLETVMRESGMLFVVAAGNNAANNNAAPLYPASFSLDNMISVAYITPFGTLAADSNYGVSSVDLAAPGQDIYSTVIGGGYRYLSGSSMATPMVSGVAALLYSCCDSAYPQNVKEIILQTIKPLEALVGFTRYAGIPDACAALAASDLLASDTIAPTLSPETVFHGSEITVKLHPEDLGGSGYRILSYAAGKRYISYFKRGTSGYVLDTPELTVSKAGTYTFYISDYAGNESTLIYDIEDDTTAPQIQASYHRTTDGAFIVSLQVTDSQSGVKRLRYQQGTHTAEEFLSSGFELDPENPTFTASFEGIYSIYAADHRGNKVVYELPIRYTATERIFLSTREITLNIGDSFQPQILLLPLNSSDFPKLTLSSDSVAKLDEHGIVTALASGSVLLTVTAGPVEKTCLIHVTEAPLGNQPVSSEENTENTDQPPFGETPETSGQQSSVDNPDETDLGEDPSDKNSSDADTTDADNSGTDNPDANTTDADNSGTDSPDANTTDTDNSGTDNSGSENSSAEKDDQLS